eukprot:9129055-Ditylum_brightwellii.AAC.1
MLGVHKALNLQERSVLQYLQEKTHQFAKAINSCPIPGSEVIAAYDSIYIPSIAYVLPTTSVTEDEIHKLHKILLPKMLQRAGYKFNFPYAVAFAPHEFLG